MDCFLLPAMFPADPTAGAEPQQDDGTHLGPLAQPREPRRSNVGPAHTAVTADVLDPAEAVVGSGMASLGCSPTPEVPPTEASTRPALAGEGQTPSFLEKRSDQDSHGQRTDGRDRDHREGRDDTRLLSSGDRFDEPSGAAFGPQGGPESSLWASKQPPRLRRNASVIEEAARFRASPVHRLSLAAAWIKAGGSAVLRAVASTMTDWSKAAVQRFERLPRWQQAVWVVAPYASAIGLIAYLYFAQVPPSAVAVDGRAAPRSPGLVVSERVDRPPASEGHRAPRASRRADDLRSAGIKSAHASAGPIPTQSVRLPVSSALFIRPDPAVIRSARLPAGHRVTLYPAFPAPQGWVLAKSEKGTVGYLSTLHVDGKRDPAFDRAQKARRRKYRRRRQGHR